jgi:DNA-binding HxlR family transcriptional regulator
MRSYGQFCAVAKALDVIGDRWTLLIVRELLVRGPSRYTDVRRGVPGIATNLLADRLRELERAGVIESRVAPPPVATTLFRLTPRGEALEPVLHELGRWGGPLLAEGRGDDDFQGHWLVVPARVLLRDHAPDDPPATIELRTDDEPVTVEVGGGDVDTRAGAASRPDAVLEGPPELVLAVLAGRLPLAEAQAAGLLYEGPPEVLARVQPDAAMSEYR